MAIQGDHGEVGTIPLKQIARLIWPSVPEARIVIKRLNRLWPISQPAVARDDTLDKRHANCSDRSSRSSMSG
jgi:hypothetical protein